MNQLKKEFEYNFTTNHNVSYYFVASILVRRAGFAFLLIKSKM